MPEHDTGRAFSFTVIGTPEPQGSKTAGKTKTGRAYVREDNRDLQPWRQAVAEAARAAVAGAEPATGPMTLHATFVLTRPKSHYGTGRNAGRLKPTAPLYVPTRPDTDKLVRAIADAITGIICRDDAQLVIVHAEKHYGTPAHAHLVVAELAPDDDQPIEL